MHCWILFAALGLAAPDDVEGVVRVYGSGAPIAGARVAAGEVQAVTDEEGRFTLRAPPGELRLEVTAADFLPLTVTLDDAAPLVLRLVSAVEEVVVVGHRAPPAIDEHVVSMEELRRVPGAFGDPVRALQSLPSVSRTSDLSGELVVRGAEATNTAVYLDGMRVPYLYHLLLGRSVVDPAIVQEVAFHPGGVPPRYGNVTQAVVDARIAEGPADRGVHGTAHLDPLDGGASLSANLSPDTTLRLSGRVGWAAAVATGALGAWNGITGQGAALPELTLPYADHTLRLDHRDGDDVWSLSAIGASDALRYVPGWVPEDVERKAIEDAGYDPYLLIQAGFFRARARWTRTAGRRTASAWVVAGRDVQQNLVPLIGKMGAGGVLDARVTQLHGTAGFSASTPLGPHAALEFGGEGVAQPSVYQDLGGDPEDEAPLPPPLKVLAGYAGSYGALPITLGDSSLTPALRLSAHRLGGPWRVVPEPQLAGRLALSRRAALVGFTGLSSQGPKVTELGAGDARALGVTRALQTSVGVELRLPHGLSLDATAYATHMWGIVVRDTQLSIVDRPNNPLAPPGNWPGLLHEEPVFRSATGQAFGGEVLLRMAPQGPQFGWLSAAVGRSFRTVDGDRMPSDADVPVALGGVYGLTLPRGFSASVRGQLTSGLPFTPLEPAYAYVFNDPSYADIAYFDHAAVPGAPNSDRYPLYARLDLRVEKTWVRPRAAWTLYLDVFNATNRRNPLWATYDWNYGELRRTAYVPIVPSLGLAVEY